MHAHLAKDGHQRPQGTHQALAGQVERRAQRLQVLLRGGCGLRPGCSHALLLLGVWTTCNPQAAHPEALQSGERLHNRQRQSSRPQEAHRHNSHPQTAA